VRRATVLLFVVAVPALADHKPLDVTLRMSGPTLAAAGSEVTYTLSLTALFPGYAYAVTDYLPPGTHFIRAGSPPWNCLESRGNVICGNEQLQNGFGSIDVTLLVPDNPQIIVNRAHVDSVSVADPTPQNNDDSVTTTIYDAASCASKTIQLIFPAPHATIVGPHVTFRWSAISSAIGYEFYAAEGSDMLTLLALTTDAQVVRDFAPGEVQWYVQALLPDCPPVATAPQTFIVGAPSLRGRAAHH